MKKKSPKKSLKKKENKLTNQVLNEETKNTLQILAGVSEKDITETIGSRAGIEFNFNNSLRANYCKMVEYKGSKVQGNDTYIIQLRKISKDPFTNQDKDELVYESIIKKDEFQEVFERQTGKYLSMYQK
jgi:hypothetical protein